MTERNASRRCRRSASLSRPVKPRPSCSHPSCAPASLSRPVSSLGLHAVTLLALRLMMPHGALASLRGRRKPPHDGMRRVGRYNLRDGLAADRRQDRQTLRTHPTRRPREDIFLPEQNALSACLHSAASRNRRNRSAALAPAELATVNPHPVQNHSQAPGDRDDGATDPAPLSHPHAPRLQPRPFPALDKQ